VETRPKRDRTDIDSCTFPLFNFRPYPGIVHNVTALWHFLGSDIFTLIEVSVAPATPYNMIYRAGGTKKTSRMVRIPCFLPIIQATTPIKQDKNPVLMKHGDRWLS
jgi:hypothetical protein